MNIFKTFKPVDAIVSRYVDYYYLDIKPDNDVAEYECFPHYNNSISLYASHSHAGNLSNSTVTYKVSGNNLQLFTPIRTDVFHVLQRGPVHRVVIVFNTLGINHFFKNVPVSKLTSGYSFFTDSELKMVFTTTDTDSLTQLLDKFLASRYCDIDDAIVGAALTRIFNGTDNVNVSFLANNLKISPRHLNRLFKKRLGVSIKKFYTVVLFRKVLDARVNGTAQNLTSLAYDHEFCDQAHLTKTVKVLTSYSPKTLFSKGTSFSDESLFWNFIK